MSFKKEWNKLEVFLNPTIMFVSTGIFDAYVNISYYIVTNVFNNNNSNTDSNVQEKVVYFRGIFP